MISQAPTAEEVEAVLFPVTRFRAGYDMDDVDDFLDRVTECLRARAAGRPADLTAHEVLTKTFLTTRIRSGYDPDRVDDFLDRVAESLS